MNSTNNVTTHEAMTRSLNGYETFTKVGMEVAGWRPTLTPFIIAVISS